LKHVPKNPDIEVLDPIPEYNKPELNPQDFLCAVYRDPRLPMPTRIEAAKAVSVYMHPRLAQVTQEVTAGITIRIQGGLPELPGTNIIMPKYDKTEPAQPPVNTKKGNGHDPSD
jgi:hypothetical protein